MTSFVLETSDGEPLGFVLFANHAGDRPPEGPIDVVFMGFPRRNSLWSDPRGALVLDHKGREWKADVRHAGGVTTVRIPLASGWVLELRGGPGGGRWSAERSGERLQGKGDFLKAGKK